MMVSSIIFLLYIAGGICATDWEVSSMNELFNKVSNGGSNTGNSIMPKGDSTVLAVKEYKCSEGTCATSWVMLYTSNLYGQIRCEDDNADCLNMVPVRITRHH
mmetsp:Transcript_1485/g.2667  ORF Transcript_1485/g.2667 Transcript_1485/m.2667 type:complete len:103 (+) Transcript_1485:1106-1414(+)